MEDNYYCESCMVYNSEDCIHDNPLEDSNIEGYKDVLKHIASHELKYNTHGLLSGRQSIEDYEHYDWENDEDIFIPNIGDK